MLFVLNGAYGGSTTGTLLITNFPFLTLEKEDEMNSKKHA